MKHRLPPEDFWRIVEEELRIDPREVRPIVGPGASTSMQIVAGAGTGKTTSLALKCLHAVFVEGVPPEGIIATTFTRKAARELQSRILGRGQQLLDALGRSAPRALTEAARLVDLNRIRTGTLDSLIQGVLNEFKSPRDPPPLPIEPFVARGLLLREGLFARGRHTQAALTDYLQTLRGRRYPATLSTPEKVDILYELRFAVLASAVDVPRYLESGAPPGARLAFDAIHDFERALSERRVADYPALSRLFLRRLREGTLPEFTSGLRLVLVDEYQDTDYLQERIYFSLAGHALSRGGGLVVVGDDDQALYRFRGATVGLFRDFVDRFARRFGPTPVRLPLVTNRRSTPEIIRYCQAFVTNDPSYQRGRTPKPALVAPEGTPDSGVPVYLLCLEGEDAQPLAERTARLIQEVMSTGWRPTPGAEPIEKDTVNGTASDIAIISASVREGDGERRTFIGHLRRALGAGLPLFNPRGRTLASVPQVAVLLGLVLEAFDPDEAQGLCAQESLPNDVRGTLATWRTAARAFQPAPPPHVTPGLTLADYVHALSRARGTPGELKTLLLSEVLYRFVTWLPYFQDDIEGLAYLEVIQRCITQGEPLGRWRSRLACDEHGLVAASVREMIWNFLVPLAADDLELDEELLATLPPHRVPVLTAHQAKGLEYPMVVVDIGSWIKDGHASPTLRYPDTQPDRPNLLADALAPYAEYVDRTREPRDQRFDDLVRKYFVAASRARQVLVLVAHQRGIHKGTPNVAAWTRRDKTQGPRPDYTETLP